MEDRVAILLVTRGNRAFLTITATTFYGTQPRESPQNIVKVLAHAVGVQSSSDHETGMQASMGPPAVQVQPSCMSKVRAAS